MYFQSFSSTPKVWFSTSVPTQCKHQKVDPPVPLAVVATHSEHQKIAVWVRQVVVLRAVPRVGQLHRQPAEAAGPEEGAPGGSHALGGGWRPVGHPAASVGDAHDCIHRQAIT